MLTKWELTKWEVGIDKVKLTKRELTKWELTKWEDTNRSRYCQHRHSDSISLSNGITKLQEKQFQCMPSLESLKATSKSTNSETTREEIVCNKLWCSLRSYIQTSSGRISWLGSSSSDFIPRNSIVAARICEVTHALTLSFGIDLMLRRLISCVTGT